MENSITKNYTFLAIAKGVNLNSMIGLNPYIATIAAGIYELEKQNIIELQKVKAEGIAVVVSEDYQITVKQELKTECSYLHTLYEVILKSEKKTLFDVVKNLSVGITKRYSEEYVDDIINSLKDDNIVSGEKKKGFLGIETAKYEVKKESVQKITNEILEGVKNGTLSEHDWLLLYLIKKTDMLSDFYNKNDRKVLKEALEVENTTDHTMQGVLEQIDKMFNILGIMLGLLPQLGI